MQTRPWSTGRKKRKMERKAVVRLLFFPYKRSGQLNYTPRCSCASRFLVLQHPMALPFVFGSICEKGLGAKQRQKRQSQRAATLSSKVVTQEQRLLAQGSPPMSPPLLASVLCAACDCGDAWMRSTHFVSSDFMDLHAFLRKHERAFSK